MGRRARRTWLLLRDCRGGGALVPTEAAPLLALTTAAASLPADLATFSAAYGTGHDGARAADVLSPPPFSEALAELGPAPSAVSAASAAADADAVPAAASSLASAVMLPMQAWVTAGVHGLGLLEQSAIETLKSSPRAAAGAAAGAGHWAAIIMEVVVLEGRGYRWRWRRRCGG